MNARFGQHELRLAPKGDGVGIYDFAFESCEIPKGRRPGEARSVAIGAIAGLCGAVLIDLYLAITEPWVAKGVTPLLVMQWDASNALGAAAYRGGWLTAALGTLMHFCVSVIWGVLFVAAALRIRRLKNTR